MLIAGTDIPVVPCWIEGAFQAWPAARKWPRALPVALSIGAPLGFADATDDADGWNRVAAACEAAVRHLGEARAVR